MRCTYVVIKQLYLPTVNMNFPCTPFKPYISNTYLICIQIFVSLFSIVNVVLQLLLMIRISFFVSCFFQFEYFFLYVYLFLKFILVQFLIQLISFIMFQYFNFNKMLFTSNKHLHFLHISSQPYIPKFAQKLHGYLFKYCQSKSLLIFRILFFQFF